MMKTNVKKSSVSTYLKDKAFTSDSLNPWFSIWTMPRRTILHLQNTYSPSNAFWWGLIMTTAAMIIILVGVREGNYWLPQGLMLRASILASFALLGTPLYVAHLCLLGKVANLLGSPVITQQLMHPFLVYSLGYTVLAVAYVLLANIAPGFIAAVFNPAAAGISLIVGVLFLGLSAWIMVVYFLCLSETLGLSKMRTLGAFALSTLIAMAVALPITAGLLCI